MSLFNTMTSLYSSWSSMRQLGEMDARRLSDLGLDRYDIYAARHMGSNARSKFFSARRGARAESWLR